MTVDMFCHWNYVLEGILGRVQSVTAKTATHIPTRWDENGQPYAATADDASYGIFELEGGDHRADQLLLGGAGLPRRTGRIPGRRHPRLRRRRAEQVRGAATGPHPEAGLEPRPAGHRVLPRPVAGGAGQRRPGQRVQVAVGGVPPRRGRRPAAPLRPAVRRPRCPAGRTRACGHPPRAGGWRSRRSRCELHRDSRRHRIDLPPLESVAVRHGRNAGAYPLGTGRPVDPAQRGRSPAGSPTPQHMWCRRRGPTTRPARPAVLDWDATLAYRHELWSYGLGVADAMDTAQRGMGLDWAATRELITRSGAEARAVGRRAGLWRRHRPARPRRPARRDAPGWQPSRRLPGADRRRQRRRGQRHPDGLPGAGPDRPRPEDYLRVYGTLLDEVEQPGHPALARHDVRRGAAGYWGTPDIPRATAVFTELIGPHAAQGRRRQGLPAGRRSRDRAAQRCCRPGSGSTPGTTSTTRN